MYQNLTREDDCFEKIPEQAHASVAVTEILMQSPTDRISHTSKSPENHTSQRVKKKVSPQRCGVMTGSSAGAVEGDELPSCISVSIA